MSLTSLVKTAIDKFKVDEIAPFFEISPTGSYGSIDSGLKNQYLLKFKDLETKNVIKKSGILNSNDSKIPSPSKTKTYLFFKEDVGDLFEWCETYWKPDFSVSSPDFVVYRTYIEGTEPTRLVSNVPFPDLLLGVIVGNIVTTIAKDSFKNCIKLISVTLSESVREIGLDAFANCTSLVSITIPYSVNTIGTRSFENCTSLTSVTLPKSGTTIDFRSFANCTNLETIEIPATVYYIDANAFSGSGLETVIIPYPNAAEVKSPDSNVTFKGKAGVNVLLPS